MRANLSLRDESLDGGELWRSILLQLVFGPSAIFKFPLAAGQKSSFEAA